MDIRDCREVTLRLPRDLAAQVDQVISQQVARAAGAGAVGRALPNRHTWLLQAVRAALRAERDAAQSEVLP